jgi:hypothetical protein
VAGLIYTAYSLIGKAGQALNAFWRVRQGRSWARKFTDYLSVVMVGPVLVVTALGLLGSVRNQALVQRVMAIQPPGGWLVWPAQFGPFFLLAGELNLSASLVDDQVELLVAHGYLGRMTEPEGVILIKSPAATSRGEVLEAVREVKALDGVAPIARMIRWPWGAAPA